jgi:hypothetical protein
MHTAIKSSHSYEFRQDFSAIAQPGVHRYLKECGFDPDEPRDGLDDCWEAGNDYVKKLWRHLKSVQRDYRDRGSSDDLELYGVEGWTRESVEAYVEQRLADILADMAPTSPIDLYRAVHLGTEMARKEGLDVGPEAVAYAADRLKSKIERDAVYNPITEVHSGFLSYHFLKGMRDGGKVVYTDHYKRRQESWAKPKAERSAGNGDQQHERDANAEALVQTAGSGPL